MTSQSLQLAAVVDGKKPEIQVQEPGPEAGDRLALALHKVHCEAVPPVHSAQVESQAWQLADVVLGKNQLSHTQLPTPVGVK